MKLSLVISVYNEEKALEGFYAETSRVLSGFIKSSPGYSYELLFVNDGSSDRSRSILSELQSRDPEHIRIISFSRNFGHEAAMTAGLDYADGDRIIFMDADLQHPPALIPEIAARFDDGFDVINMTRRSNHDAGLFKNITSATFYRLINSMSRMKLEPGASDFFAISRQAAEVLRTNYREKVRFLRGYVQNIGFRKTTIDYDAADRIAGSSHYSIGKLFRFSIETIMCFSDMPLKIGIYAGLLSGLAGIVLIIYSLIMRHTAPGGYTTIITVLCFMFAVLFVIVGITGEYISLIFREVRDRPIYIIEDISGLTSSASEPQKAPDPKP